MAIPIWKDKIVDLGTSESVDFCIKLEHPSGQMIYRGKAHRKPGETLNLSGEAKGLEVNFPKTNGWKSAKFATPLRGRYVCIEAIGTAGDEQACIAELYFKDETGERLSREPWKVRYADSEDIKTGNHAADKIYDLQESTYWSTEKGAKFPHYIVIDLGKVRNLTEFEYLPRME